MVMNFEWRPEYKIIIHGSNNSVRIDDPWYGSFGIYDHLEVQQLTDRVRILPRFMFGIDEENKERMYKGVIDNMPIIGLFSNSNDFDKVYIVGYLSAVLAVVFHLVAKNNKSEFEKKHAN